VEPHEIEQLRLSIVMLPPGHSGGALTRQAALDLLDEVAASHEETVRYKQAVAELRRVIDALEVEA
jgi:hypothetical protein